MEPTDGGDSEIHARLLPKDELEEIYTHEQLLHSIGSFSAIVWPVSVTMLLASFFSVNVQDPETAELLANAYLVYSGPSEKDSSGSTLIGHAFINAFAVICVVICVTFLMVALYKYNFFKCLAGYLVFSSGLLLSDLGGHLLYIILYQLQLTWPVVDLVSFLVGVYNFAVVGVIAIFYQKGTSPLLSQVYLVASSVILAWQFSQFPEWTTWALLVLLAFYDLCAVLTPCGPLKCLVNLIQKEGRPLPGLLYEAKVTTTSTGSSASVGTSSGRRRRPPQAKSNSDQQYYYQYASSESSGAVPATAPQGAGPSTGADLANRLVQHSPVTFLMAETERRALLREKLVRFYRQYNPNAIDRIDVIMDKYRNQEARLWQDLYDKYVSDEDGESSIKLGLGDFIFYSVLVSRAAQYDFSAMVACLVSILMGLMGTMFLLGIYQSALPALPISILLAVTMYFWLYGTFVAFVSPALDSGVMY